MQICITKPILLNLVVMVMKVKKSELDYSRIYEELVRKCTEAGTNISQVCRDADVSRSVLERWKKETPKSIEILSRLLMAIDKASAGKN